MKKILYPILAVIVFAVMQALGSVGMVAISFIKNPKVFMEIAKSGNQAAIMAYTTMGDTLPWALVLSGIGTVVIIAALKMIDWKYVLNFKMIDWKVGMLAIVGAIFLIFYMDVLLEYLNLPDDMSNIFAGMSVTVIGALSIGIIGPIVEEFVFREALLGSMLKNGMNKWVAITASALVFGIIHWNPAQIPFAIIIGFIFGIIYYKTGNIVIPSILHILNNSTAVVMMIVMGEEAEDAKLTEWMGGPAMALGICIPISVIGINWLRVFYKKYQTVRFADMPTAVVELNEPTDIVEATNIVEPTAAVESTEQTNQIPISNETIL